ncbi:MAG: hypothetical protein ACUVTX_02470 [Bacteroidales bacterium]
MTVPRGKFVALLGPISIFNEGAGFNEIAFPAMALTATGILFFAAGLKIFKWH